MGDKNAEFNWIQMRKDIGLADIEEMQVETFTDKFRRKFKENPAVPIGLFMTTVCLVLGLRTLTTGDSKRSQLMMRGRVLAQGFTIAALVTGICWKTTSTTVKED